jgi:glycosyltransferase EpsE
MSNLKRSHRISIAMGIYNCAPTLSESIESILHQTYQDWELIMCDDASTDDTYKVASEYAKKYDNIHVLRNDTNLGLAATLNKCIANACPEAEFIARQDGDDLSEPDRFETQINFLDTHHEYAFVSTAMTCFDESGDWGVQARPEKPQAKDFIKNSPFCHAPVMMRKKELSLVGNYTVNKYLRRGQDYYLWHKFYCKGYFGYNIQKPYYKMRDDRAATSRRSFKARVYGAKVQIEIMRNLGIPAWNYIYALRGILVGMIPAPIYEYLHRKAVKRATSKNLK